MEDEVILTVREEMKKVNLIFTRNRLLADSDKYMLSDFPITPENLEIIKQYRQELRDFTTNGFIIPEKPNI